MAEKYYIDTSIWRDFYENRVDNIRPLGEWAFELFRMIRENREKAIYSDLVMDELKKDFNKEEIDKILSIMEDEGLLEKVDINKEQTKEAAKLCKSLKIPFSDALHAILARDNGAIMVARDKHFHEIHKIVDLKKPEDLI